LSTAQGAPAALGIRRPHGADKVSAVHAALDAGKVDVAFQPIVDLRRRRLHAYEVLARPVSDLFASPAELFEVASQAGRVAELGRLHRAHAVVHCATHSLFVNIDPHEFDYGWLVRPDDPIFAHRHPVTVEITESVPIQYFSQCRSVLAEIRKRNVSLAIDDFGAGYSNIKYIADLDPDVVKLDRQLTEHLDGDAKLRRLSRWVVKLCHEMGAKVVAEGIESLSELSAVEEIGVDFAQGYLFARPTRVPVEPRWPTV
jgi:EAL domain-containing protein (putative c-di-GMP-specific phosphodiesterase class I)